MPSTVHLWLGRKQSVTFPVALECFVRGRCVDGKGVCRFPLDFKASTRVVLHGRSQKFIFPAGSAREMARTAG